MTPYYVTEWLRNRYLYRLVRFYEKIEDMESIIDEGMVGAIKNIVHKPEWEDERNCLVYEFTFDLKCFYKHNKTCMKRLWFKDDSYNATAEEAGYWKDKENVFIQVEIIERNIDISYIESLFEVIDKVEAFSLLAALEKTSYGDFYVENGVIKADRDIKKGECVHIDPRVLEVVSAH